MTAFSGDSHDLESPGFVVVRKVPLRNGKFQDRFRNAGCYISFGVKGGKSLAVQTQSENAPNFLRMFKKWFK